MAIKVTQAFSEVLKGVVDKDIVYGYVKQMAQNLHRSHQGFTTVKIMNKYLEDYVSRSGDLQNAVPEKKHVFTEYI